MAQAKDMTGLRFERLMVLKRDDTKKSRNAYWLCGCDCGNIISVSRPNLINKHVSSCGCLRREIISKRHLIDLTGQRFGKLLVLGRDDNPPTNKAVYWKCQCDCGGITSVRSIHLRKNKTISCGCVKSRGEEAIAQLLKEDNIPFVKQYKVRINQQNYYFDFAIFDVNNNLKYFIEFDGEQHFNFRKNGWNSKDNLEQTQRRDLLKNTYCQKAGIPLIRVKYTDIITLENITSN